MSKPVVAGMAPSVAEKTRAAGPYPRRGMTPSWMAGVSAVIQDWAERSRQRRALGALDDHLLRDIGVSRQQALREAAQWFWRC
jgi:uncharacterized protein YjiS (DUF1127 family)